MSLSVRWRLALWNALAFGALLVAFAALVYILARRDAVAAVDRKLQNSLDQFARDERNVDDPARLQHWIGEFWEHDQVACAVFDPDGKRRERTLELTSDALPDQPLPTGGGPSFATIAHPILQRQRVLTAPLPNDAKGRTVVLLASTAEADHSLAQLQVALFTAVPVIFVAAAGVSYLLAGRALAPVARLTEATRQITAERLADRLPVANPLDELGCLAATVNDLLARLEAAFSAQRQFTADASHELRTPLAVLRTEVEIALRKPPPPAEFPALLASLVEECDRLGKLTDQLLALARHDAQKSQFRREPVALNEVVAGVVESLRPLADAKGVNIRCEPGAAAPVVTGDADELGRAVTNLVENGVKYTPAGGSVAIRVGADDGMARVEVIDTGEGIPVGYLSKVFDRFYRVDKARSREQGGTGLGLSIARSVIEAHGGRVELKSELGRGTTATVTLPLATEPG
jgi:heavy metal sensor kinase